MDNQHVQLPSGFRQLETQVAGHTFEATNASSIGLLQNSIEGCVLKPLGKPECGERELRFYESLQTESDVGGEHVLAEAKALVPMFFAKVNLNVNKKEHMFLKLEDLTLGMCKPCIMDIKIGRRTWDPLASPHKKIVEEQKYLHCKQVLGLCLPGFQVYVPSTETKSNELTLIRHGKDYGKQLDADGFRRTMALFLNIDTSESRRHCSATVSLVQEVLHQLYNIRNWFYHQNLFHFYASSLLITYDFLQLQKARTKAKPHLNGITSRTKSLKDTVSLSPAVSDWVKVRMIDFAHVFPAQNGEQDSNYLFGLNNLIKIIEELVEAL